MKEENDYLGDVDEALMKKAPVNRLEFRVRLRSHLALDPRPPRSWIRVLRRYYTASRRLEDDTLLSVAFDHLESIPDTARHILDYLSVFRLTTSRFQRLTETARRLTGVYEDVDILIHEYLATAPNVGTGSLRDEIGDWAMDEVRRNLLGNPRVASGAVITLGKFGRDQHIDGLEKVFDIAMSADTPARQQALVVLLGARRLSFGDLRALPPAAGSQSLSHLSFLGALYDGEPKAIQMCMKLLKPILRNEPRRYTARARLLFLAPVLREIAPGEGPKIVEYRDTLRTNPPRLRDVAAQDWLSR
jgi:hypothetical protein